MATGFHEEDKICGSHGQGGLVVQRVGIYQFGLDNGRIEQGLYYALTASVNSAAVILIISVMQYILISISFALEFYMEMNPALILLVIAVAAYVVSKRMRFKLALGKVQKLVADGVPVLFLDVRTQAEHLERRIPGSINVPLDQLHTGISRVAPDKSAPLAVYCLSGSRAASARGVLKGLGYTNPINIGAIASWPGEFASGKSEKKRKA